MLSKTKASVIIDHVVNYTKVKLLLVQLFAKSSAVQLVIIIHSGKTLPQVFSIARIVQSVSI